MSKSFLQKFPQFVNIRQSLLQVLRHFGRGFVGGHAHRLVVILNDIFHKFLVARFAEHYADGRVFVRLFHMVVQDAEKIRQSQLTILIRRLRPPNLSMLITSSPNTFSGVFRQVFPNGEIHGKLYTIDIFQCLVLPLQNSGLDGLDSL